MLDAKAKIRRVFAVRNRVAGGNPQFETAAPHSIIGIDLFGARMAAIEPHNSPFGHIPAPNKCAELIRENIRNPAMVSSVCDEIKAIADLARGDLMWWRHSFALF